MLTLFAFHSQIDLNVTVEGDTWSDAHHTVEDVGIALGQMIAKHLATRSGFADMGRVYLPMDETLARAVIASWQSVLVYDATIKNPKLGDFDTELAEEKIFPCGRDECTSDVTFVRLIRLELAPYDRRVIQSVRSCAPRSDFVRWVRSSAVNERMD